MSVLSLLRFVAGHPLNSGQRVRALLRLARWQIGSRLVAGDIVHAWVNGSKFLVRSGETGLTGNVYGGLQEFAEMAYLMHVLRADELFVDVGANVGSYTLLACAAVGGRGVAIEPVPATYQRLVENLRLNHLETSVQSFNLAVGNAPGVLRFSCDMDVGNRALTDGEVREGGIVVPVTTLDLLLKDQSPTLIKIDVEGYESPVVAGAEQTLQKASLHSVIMELNGSGEKFGFDEGRVFEAMADHGFGAYAYLPQTRQLAANREGQPRTDNIIFVRDLPAVQARVRDVAAFSVNGKQV